MNWIILGVLALNVVTFFVYGLDKKRAREGAWRIPEDTLLALSFFGGSLGANLGMRVFHHKTHHKSFRILNPVFLIIHLVAIFIIILSL